MTPSTSMPSTKKNRRSKLTKLLCLLMICILLPIQSAWASNVESSLVVGIQSTKTTLLFPLDPKERDIVSVYDLIYESLININDDYLPEGGIAESWESTANGRTWTFHLRKNVKFSDGTPLTAYDVLATINYILERAKDPNSTDKGYYQNLRYYIDSASAKDEQTLTIKATSERSYWGLLYELTFPILPADRVATENPPGSGAYMINQFQPGNYVSLTTNPYWWKNQPQVKDITLMIHDTAKAVIESYQYARVNTIFTRSIAAAQYKSGINSLALDYRTNQLECLLMNHSYTKLKSAAVRKAIRYTVDVDKIASNIYGGMVNRTNTPYISGTWMYNENVDSSYGVDIEAAKKLLADDGWDDSNEDGILDKVGEDGNLLSLTLNLYVYEEPDDNVRLETAQMIADSLEQIGIKVTITTMTYTSIKEKLDAGSFHLALVSYAMDATPDYGFMLMGGNTGNYSRYRSESMTSLCKSLRKCQSQTEFRNVLYDIQSKFTQDCPFICMFYRSGVVLTRKMYTVARDVRELELLRGIESFSTR